MTSGYFDAAAGLPWHRAAVEAMQAALADGWADPRLLTGPGRRSAVLLDASRAAVAAEFGIQPDELVFTPSGGHALQYAVLGSLAGRRRAGRRLVHSAVEHSVVFAAADRHRADGGTVDVVPVDGAGRVAAATFLAAARQPDVATAVLQAANHEVGSRQPIAEVAAGLGFENGPALVVDASHELVYGSAPDGAGVFTADARLWGGPAGVGLLVVRRGVRWRPPFPTDESEDGRGLGVPSVPAVVAAAAALRATRVDRAAWADRLAEYVEQLRRRVPALVPDAVLLGPDQAGQRLPHVLTISVPYADGQALLTELDRHGFAVSSGSSCTSDTLTPSHVLVAMGALSTGNVRISLHPGVEQADLDRFLAVLAGAVADVRAALPTTGPSLTTPSQPTKARVLDSRGRRCPLPILDLARAMPGLPVGGEIVLLADDPAAANDVPAWCRLTGQQLVSDTPAGEYRVRRVR